MSAEAGPCDRKGDIRDGEGHRPGMARAKGQSGDAGAAALDAARARLRAVPPKTFTRERDALARSLKEQGHTSEAAALKKTRRGSASVWVINALASEESGALQEVLTNGAQVRLAQRRAVSGMGRTQLRDASRAFSEAVQHALDRARERLRDAGEPTGAAVLERVRQTLLASAEASDETRSVLAEGRLEEDLSPVGFGFAPPLQVLEGGGGVKSEEPAAPDPKEEARRLAEEREAARRRHALAQKEVARAQQALKTAESEHQRLEKVAQAAEARAAAARERAEEALFAVKARQEALEAAEKRLADT